MKKKTEKSNVGKIHPGKNQRFLFKEKETFQSVAELETKIWSNPRIPIL